MVISSVDSNMVSLQKKWQHNKRLLIQSSGVKTDFMTGQNNHEAQTENRTNAVGESISLNNRNKLTQVSGSQVDMHTLEQIIFNEVRSEVYDVMATVEARIQDAVLTAIESMVIPTIEWAMKSVNACLLGQL